PEAAAQGFGARRTVSHPARRPAPAAAASRAGSPRVARAGRPPAADLRRAARRRTRAVLRVAARVLPDLRLARTAAGAPDRRPLPSQTGPLHPRSLPRMPHRLPESATVGPRPRLLLPRQLRRAWRGAVGVALRHEPRGVRGPRAPGRGTHRTATMA